MSERAKLSEADLQWMQEWADEWASTDLPDLNETRMARLALSALSEIREHRARPTVCATCAMFAAQDNAARDEPPIGAAEAALVLQELANYGRSAPSLTPEDVEALRTARDVVSDSDVLEWDGIGERDAALAALDKLLGNGGGR